MPKNLYQPGNVPKNFKGFYSPRILKCPKTKFKVVVTTSDQFPVTVRGKKTMARKKKYYARYLYEQAHGKLPEGMIVVNIGDKLNIELDNLIAVTCAEWFSYIRSFRWTGGKDGQKEVRSRYSTLCAPKQIKEVGLPL